MYIWLQDIRQALRRLAARPGFTAVAVLTLAVGIGANSAIFSVVDALWLRFFNLPNADRMVVLWGFFPGQLEMPLSLPDYRDYRDQNTSFEHLAAYRADGVTLVENEGGVRLTVAEASASIAEVVGFRPLHGRFFNTEDDRVEAPPVAVLSYSLWRDRFGSDTKVIGETLTFDGQPTTVIGVVPDLRLEFLGMPELWMPLAHTDPALDDRGRRSNTMATGLLKEGVTIEQARTDVQAIAARLAAEYPENNYDTSAGVALMRDRLMQDYKPALQLLWGAVLLVLLIACANVANLLLARGAERRRELAVRTSLGAGRRRLLRLLLSESLTLAIAGGAGGLLLALWAIDALGSVAQRFSPGHAVSLDGRVLGFTLTLTLATGLLFGLAPVFQAWRLDVQNVLKDGGSGGDRRGQWLRQLLVAGQVALAVVLSIAAGLLAHSMWQLQNSDPGYRTDGVLTAQLTLKPSDYDEAGMLNFTQALLPELQALPDVETAAFGYPAPLSRSRSGSNFQPDTIESSEPGDQPSISFHIVSPEYLEALQIPLLRGRWFSPQDAVDSPGVAVIDRLTAERYWPDMDPLGRRLKRGGGEWLEVVGVVESVHYMRLDGEPEPCLYFPLAQNPTSFLGIVLHSRGGDAAALTGSVRAAVSRLDPSLPLENNATLTERVAQHSRSRRYPALMLGLFAILALSLAAVGIYGVVSYSVTRRTREIGLRMALGARRDQVMRGVLGQGLRLSLSGAAIGLLAAVGLSRFLESLLYQVEPLDPSTFATVAAGLVVIALLAGYPAARRAARVEPMTALRYE